MACNLRFRQKCSTGTSLFHQKCSTGTSLNQKLTKHTQKHQKCIVFKLSSFSRMHIKKRRNGEQYAFFAKNVPQGRPSSKSQQKTQKNIRNVCFSTFFHFYACTSKNGEMACNFRFSPKMFHRDVPSAKVTIAFKNKSKTFFFA